MGAGIELRLDFDGASLRRLARRTTNASQGRRLLALAEIYDGSSRSGAGKHGRQQVSLAGRSLTPFPSLYGLPRLRIALCLVTGKAT
jgi:hypothetical protein